MEAAAQRSFPRDEVGSCPEQGKVVHEQVRGVQLANGYFRFVYTPRVGYLLTDAGLGPGGGGGALGPGGGGGGALGGAGSRWFRL